MNELILKMTAYLKEGPDKYNSHPWIIFSFNSLVTIWRNEGRGSSFEIEVKGLEEFWT